MLTRVRRTARAAHRDEAGNTVLLYPFALLVVLALGGIALDTALVFQAHREVVDVAAGLATDVAGVLDEAAFAQRGEIVIDASRAAQIVAVTNTHLADHPNRIRCDAAIRRASPRVVDVHCTGAAQAILLPVAGIAGDVSLRGTSTASAASR